MTRKALLLAAILLAINVACVGLALRTPRVIDVQWRKGPPIHEQSLYGPIRGPRTFWAFSAVFIDAYVLVALGGFALARGRGLQPSRAGIGIALLAPLLAFGITEGALRVYIRHAHPGHFRPHPDFFYWNARGLRNSREFVDFTPESTNSLGFRGQEEVPAGKPPGEFRVVVVGDSSAFGHGVRDDETFSYQLQRILEQDLNRPVRVINAACPGHCTWEGLVIFREMLLPLQPDLLVVSYNNDPAPEFVEEKKRAPTSAAARTLRRFLFRSEFFLVFQRTVQNAFFSLSPSRRGEAPPTVPRVSMEDYQANLKAFSEMGAQHGCRVLYQRMPVNYPLLETAVDRRVFINPAYPEALEEVCRREGYPLVDVDGAWRDAAVQDVFLPGHHFHPNARGHLLIAEQTAARIEAILSGHADSSAPAGTPALVGIRPVTGARAATEAPSANDTSFVGPGDTAGRTHVTIGYSTLTPLHCALGEILARTDILARHGLAGTFLPFLHGKDQGEALTRGGVDATFSCEVPAMIHLDQHPEQMIAGSPGELGEIALVTRRGSSPSSTGDLRGRQVALAGGGTEQFLLRQWVAPDGLDPDNDLRIRLTPGSGESAIASLLEGKVDAVALWDPWLSKTSDERKLSTLRQAPIWSLIFLDRRFLEATDGRAQRYLDAVAEALDWAASHLDEVSGWVTERSGLPVNTVRAVLRKNRYLRRETAPRLDLGDDLRRRLRECEAFAVERRLVSSGFTLETRIRELPRPTPPPERRR